MVGGLICKVAHACTVSVKTLPIICIGCPFEFLVIDELGSIPAEVTHVFMWFLSSLSQRRQETKQARWVGDDTPESVQGYIRPPAAYPSVFGVGFSAQETEDHRQQLWNA